MEHDLYLEPESNSANQELEFMIGDRLHLQIMMWWCSRKLS